MHIRISGIEEHTARVQEIVDGVSVTRRPLGSVTLRFKFEGGGRTIKQKVRNSRGFGQLMNDGHTYHLTTQPDDFAWVTVTYKILPASANPYNAGTVDELKARALTAIRQKVKSLSTP